MIQHLDLKSRLSRTLLTATDVSVAALVFVLPFIMGGREAWGHWFLITVSLCLGIFWCLNAFVVAERYSVSFLELFFAAGLLLAWYQTQPISAQTLNQLSPEYSRLLPAWSQTQLPQHELPEPLSGILPKTHPESSQTVARQWSTISLTPVETRHAWWVFAAYAVIGLVTFQRIRSIDDSQRMLKWVGASGLFMTVFGLIQWATSNGRFFWFYEQPYTDTTLHLKGAFTNRNHFAQFLSLSLGPLLWWLVDSARKVSDAPTATALSSGFRIRRRSKRSRSKNKSNDKWTQALNSTPTNGVERYLSMTVLFLLTSVSIVFLAVLMSLSRGGMIAAVTTLSIAVAGLWRNVKSGSVWVALMIGGGALTLSLMAFVDQEELQAKIDQVLSIDAEQVDGNGVRRAIWSADAKVIQRFPVLGTGVGSHREVYPLYMENFAEFSLAEMTHAESSFVQIALETGFVGAGALGLALVFVILRLIVSFVRSDTSASRACIVVVVGSTIGAILHAVADFIWYVPAIVVVSLILLTAGLRAAATNQEASLPWTLPVPRILWLGCAVVLVIGLVKIQPDLMRRIDGEHHWHAYLTTRMAMPVDSQDGFAHLEAGDAISLEVRPVSHTSEEQSEASRRAAERRMIESEADFVQTRIQHLLESLKAKPDQHRVQLVLAEQLLRLFELEQHLSENPLPLNMISDAAVASGFGSPAELKAWAQRACGPRLQMVDVADQLLRVSLAACPVQGKAYARLVDTNFLVDPQNALHDQLLEQALLVRGHDPDIRFVAGREAMLQGQTDQALEYWASVFHAGQHYRLGILKMVAAQMPVEFFLQNFSPNSEELKDLLVIYDATDRVRDGEIVLRELCRTIPEESYGIEDEDERLKELLFAYKCAERLKDFETAVEILRPVIVDFPLAYEPRHYLGMALLELGQAEEAIEHLKWCNEQDPGNIWIPNLIRQARIQLLREEEESSRRANLSF